MSIHVDSEVFHVKSEEVITQGTDVWMSLRPQYIRLNEEGTGQYDNVLEGTINYIEYLGGLVKGEVLLSNDITLEFEHPIRGNSAPDLKKGQTVRGMFSPEDLVIGRNIRKLN